MLTKCCYLSGRSEIQDGHHLEKHILNFFKLHQWDLAETHQEWSWDDADQVLLLFGSVRNPRWEPWPPSWKTHFKLLLKFHQWDLAKTHQEWSCDDADQVLLLFWLVRDPRWPPWPPSWKTHFKPLLQFHQWDLVETCQEWSWDDADQVLLFFGSVRHYRHLEKHILNFFSSSTSAI